MSKISFMPFLFCILFLSKIKTTDAHSQACMTSFGTIFENGTLIDSTYMPVTDRVKIQDTFNYYWSAITGIKPSLSGSVLSINSGNVTLPFVTTTVGITPVVRTLNTSFQVSTTRNAIVIYTVSISVASALTGTNSGTVSLQISPNNSTWTTINLAFNSGAGVLSTNVQAAPIFAVIPIGYYVKLLTTSTGTNTVVFSYLSGQETLQ